MTMAQYQPTEHHPAFEEYCETIFELEEDGLKVIQARIAERMEISRPAVSEMIRRMTHEGLVEKQRHELRLTKSGRELATRVVRRHRLAERFLTDVLGLSWSEAHHEAGKWEHIISDSVEEAFVKLLDDPTTCPHGNPIPGSGYIKPEAAPLAELASGEQVVISRIPEELEFVPGMLEFLEQNKIVPGATATVRRSENETGTSLEVDGALVDLDEHAAGCILALNDN